MISVISDIQTELVISRNEIEITEIELDISEIKLQILINDFRNIESTINLK